MDQTWCPGNLASMLVRSNNVWSTWPHASAVSVSWFKHVKVK